MLHSHIAKYPWRVLIALIVIIVLIWWLVSYKVLSNESKNSKEKLIQKIGQNYPEAKDYVSGALSSKVIKSEQDGDNWYFQLISTRTDGLTDEAFCYKGDKDGKIEKTGQFIPSTIQPVDISVRDCSTKQPSSKY